MTYAKGMTNDSAVMPEPAQLSTPSAEEPTPDDGASSSLAVDLRIAITRVTRRLRAQRGKADLIEGHLGVLTTLKRHGAMSPGVLAEHEGVRPPSMTRTINALADLGFVTKVEHPTDGRQVVVELSEAGRAEVLETRRRRDLWLARQLLELTSSERKTLAAATELLTRISST